MPGTLVRYCIEAVDTCFINDFKVVVILPTLKSP